MRIGTLVLAAIVPLVNVALGQAATLDSMRGVWHLEPSRAAHTEQLTCASDEKNARDGDTMSFPIAASELGMSDALESTSSTNTSFVITRDAGTFSATGTASRDKAGGTFTFSPSETYRSRMQDRGYRDLDVHDLFTAFSLDLTSVFIDDVVAAGYPHLTFGHLVAFRALGVDRAFIDEMHAAFPKMEIDADEMTSLRALAVSRSYVSQLRAEGLAIDGPRDAVQLRALGIDAAYVQRVEAHGLHHLPVDKLIQLKALGVISARLQGISA